MINLPVRPEPDPFGAIDPTGSQPNGTVYLVGAGPGDIELLTVRATKLLERADVVVFDALVGKGVLAAIPNRTQMVDVGKRRGHPISQEEINQILVNLAGEHQTVVRLKGGDPFVFGRGGEEAMAMGMAGIRCEIVPGVSSAFAAPASAGIPVTHRGVASAVTVVTGHRSIGQPPVDWGAHAKTGATLVILMGVSERANIAARLMAGGASAETPVAVITSATTGDQLVRRSVLGKLGTLDVAPPATIVIGDVVGLECGVRFVSSF